MVTDLSATSSIIVTIIAILRLYSAVIVLAVISAFLVQVIIQWHIKFIINKTHRQPPTVLYLIYFPPR